MQTNVLDCATISANQLMPGHGVGIDSGMGRKLVALVLVICAVGVASAVLVPFLLEDRSAALESAAAAALKSAVLPAEVQFQAGGYCDRDCNGIGSYAVVGIRDRDGSPRDPYRVLAGAEPIAGGTLDLLAPDFAKSSPLVGEYVFTPPVSDLAPGTDNDGDGGAERRWAALAYPAGSRGRCFFAINQSGNVFVLPEPAAASGARVVKREGETIRELAERTTIQDVFGDSYDEIPAHVWNKRPMPRTTHIAPAVEWYPRR